MPASGSQARRAGVRALAGMLVCSVLTGCTSFAETLRQFDAVARLDERPELVATEQRIDYVRSPAQYPWGLRQLDGTGVDRAWIWLFDVEPYPIKVSNPSGYARERIRRLSRLAEGDLRRTALVTTRLHLVATADVNRLNRVAAMRAAARLLGAMGIDPIGTLQMRTLRPVDLRSLEPGWPGKDETRDATTRREHLVALLRVSSHPADDLATQRELVRLLANAERLERDPVVRRATRVALRNAVDFALSFVLLRGLEPNVLVHEREIAFHELRTLGGPDAMPTLLALVVGLEPGGAVPDDGYLDGQPIDVRRAVVAACARLRGPILEAGFRYPRGAERVLGPAPVQVLYDVAIGDPDPGLRKVALEGLASCLERSTDVDDDWARAWYRARALDRL